jgi:hypothetical protein
VPLSWNIAVRQKLVTLRYNRTVSAQEWCAAVDAILEDARHEPGFSWLVDRRAADPPTRELAEAIVAHLHARMERLGEHCRVAILVNRSTTDFGMARMQAALNDVIGLHTLIFDNEEKAVAWLIEGQPGLQAKAPAESPARREEPVPAGWATITCPSCGHSALESMPQDACLFFYQCRSCGVVLKPKAGDCCVFCSYGDAPCPSRRSQGGQSSH